MRPARRALTFVMAATAGGALAIAPAPAQAVQRAALDWVALGDSYTAGVIRAAGQEFETPRDGCGRTDKSYPQVIARELGPAVKLTNVSCGGATIADIVTEKQQPTGRHAPPVSRDPDHPFDAVPVQADALSPATDVVTVGIGGNSLGFGEILRTCVERGLVAGGRGTPCKDHYAGQIATRLQRVRGEYDQMLTRIHLDAPNAAVITVGYPYLIPTDTTKCAYASVVGFATVTRGDLNWLRTHALEPLNRMIREQTARHSDRYVDLYESSRGHSICEKAGGANWAEGIFDTALRPALVHPNVKGHRNAANKVTEALLATST